LSLCGVEHNAEWARFAPHLTPVSLALLPQMAWTAACNRHHSVDQQLFRWLLMSLDRLARLTVASAAFVQAETDRSFFFHTQPALEAVT
jgi:hypothetical protein